MLLPTISPTILVLFQGFGSDDGSDSVQLVNKLVSVSLKKPIGFDSSDVSPSVSIMSSISGKVLKSSCTSVVFATSVASSEGSSEQGMDFPEKSAAQAIEGTVICSSVTGSFGIFDSERTSLVTISSSISVSFDSSSSSSLLVCPIKIVGRVTVVSGSS